MLEIGKMISKSQRSEVWTNDETGEKFYESGFATGPEDKSRRTMHGEYDPNCPCCWFGFNHSINEHNRAIGRR